MTEPTLLQQARKCVACNKGEYYLDPERKRWECRWCGCNKDLLADVGECLDAFRKERKWADEDETIREPDIAEQVELLIVPAIERLALYLKLLEQREAAMRGPAQVPTASTLQRYTSAAQVPGEPIPKRGQTVQEAYESMRAATPALDLDELQRLCDAATPGPWDVEDGVVLRKVGDVIFVEDAAFIAAARDALPKLIARVRELEARVNEADYLDRVTDPRGPGIVVGGEHG
jgi:hypothetical protein